MYCVDIILLHRGYLFTLVISHNVSLVNTENTINNLHILFYTQYDFVAMNTNFFVINYLKIVPTKYKKQ